MSLEGKNAIVTGAGRGIGKAIAGALAQRGCQVVIAERLAELGEATAQEITSAYGQRSIAIPVDVSDLGSVKEMVEKALGEFGRIDILVNNAGVTRDNLIMRMEESDWDTVMDINLKGAWNVAKHHPPDDEAALWTHHQHFLGFRPGRTDRDRPIIQLPKLA